MDKTAKTLEKSATATAASSLAAPPQRLTLCCWLRSGAERALKRRAQKRPLLLLESASHLLLAGQLARLPEAVHGAGAQEGEHLGREAGVEVLLNEAIGPLGEEALGV